MPNPRSLLAVFAHPDDESFGPGGTLAKYAAEGVEVWLVCGTDGDAGTVDGLIERVQDLGTSMLITVRVGTASVKVRTPVQTELETSLATAGAQAAGRKLRLSVVNSHSRFYRNEALIT